ncbi:hypothetical protein BGZ72_000217, partial [Mortierella alpina]
PKVRKRAEQYQKENELEGIGEGGKFSNQDRRLLWGSQDRNLHAARKYYFDEAPTKYERLATNKARFDPLGVFTANDFSVRAKAPGKEAAKEAAFKKAAIRLWRTIAGGPEKRNENREEDLAAL